MKKTVYRFVIFILFVFFTGFFIPEKPTIPVKHATSKDWHPQSFWYEPWGKSGVHKGIDIFAKKGTPVLASTHGVVISTGHNNRGGKYVLMLGSNWQVHYFAHLDHIKTRPLAIKKAGSLLATVGDSGNAKGKAPHLHWSIKRLIPLPWKADSSTQGYKKAYFVNPTEFLKQKKAEADVNR